MLTEASSLRVGTAGWNIPRQHASELSREGSHLERYAQTLPCTEINATFYRSPRVSTWARWAASVPAGFRFSVKAPRAITHDAALACPEDQLRGFLMEAQLLGKHLGPILFQLPPKLSFDEATATGFLQKLRQMYSGMVALEPRHASWFTEEADLLLQSHHAARVAADPAIANAASHPGGWPGLVYFRLHGSPRRYYSAYDRDFLERLARTLCQHEPSSELWCIFDNTASGAALGDALTLRRLTACCPAPPAGHPSRII